MRYEPIETSHAGLGELTFGAATCIVTPARTERSDRLLRERALSARSRSRSPGAHQSLTRPGTTAASGSTNGLARVTLEAAHVTWPSAERRSVALVCCTPDDHFAGALPRGARAAIAAMIAVLVNGAFPRAVVTCTARTSDDAATICVDASRFGACILDVSRELHGLLADPRAIPEQPGLRLDLWRAGKLAVLVGAHLSFVPRASGAIAFELRFPTLGAASYR